MVVTRIFQYALSFRYRFNGFWLRAYLILLGCKAGSGLKALSFPTFREIPRSNIRLGRNVVFGRGVVIEMVASGSLIIGDNCTIGDYNRISSPGSIELGNWVSLAEQVSIRGSFHHTDRNRILVQQSSESRPIKFGNDIGVGAFTIFLMGVDIPDGVVIGAQSLVKKSDKLHAYGIFAGSPLKHIRDRE